MPSPFHLRMETAMTEELFSVLTNTHFWWTFVVVSAVPYALFVVAYIGESRRPGNNPDDVPVWRDQSRAFLPGDFGLALMFTCCLQYRGDVTARWAVSTWLGLSALCIGIATFLFARLFLYTTANYSKAAWNSPSKRYHDFVMYLLFGAAAIYVCIPVYFASQWQSSVLVKLLGLFGLAVWVVGNIYDFTHSETPNRRQHPHEYQPIWRKS